LPTHDPQVLLLTRETDVNSPLDIHLREAVRSRHMCRGQVREPMLDLVLAHARAHLHSFADVAGLRWSATSKAFKV
jgi:hypothetical protein